VAVALTNQKGVIRRYLLPISTNGDLNANAAPQIVGWLLRDPTGRYHEWGSSGPKFNTTEEALAYLMQQCTVEPVSSSKNVQGAQ
jgi:hypothetical protein